LAHAEVKVQFALTHFGLIDIVDRDGHRASVVIADGGVVAPDFLALKHDGSRFHLAIGIFEGRGYSKFGVLYEELLRHTGCYGSRHVLTHNLKRLRITREIL